MHLRNVINSVREPLECDRWQESKWSTKDTTDNGLQFHKDKSFGPKLAKPRHISSQN